ncbi:MAG TPA: biopolymer transporter ExbD [Planctomycetota bacterium]|nr:biopolymer transporter ExbD [Planctomycetota bacterium]
MAGASAGESTENPVAINVTAMVDVIFCLCVFFMCSLHFRQAEGKFETWLPKGKGGEGPLGTAPAPEMRVALFWDADRMATVRQFGQRIVPSDAELEALIRDSHADLLRLQQPAVPLTIDADARVPWDDVVDVVNMGKRQAVERIEFALGAAPAR